jgi:ubiquinone/menaquinone biosynthesis C-methylase UbiE
MMPSLHEEANTALTGKWIGWRNPLHSMIMRDSMDTRLDATQQAAAAQFTRQSNATGHILEDVSDLQEALNYLPMTKQMRVLDVACGAGHCGLHLASLGHEVTLADVSEGMLQRTREAAERRGFSVTTNQHAAEAMPYENASFDLVTCRVAPHHFSSPAQFVRETARVLKPHGHFLLIDGTVPDGEMEAAEWLNRVEKLRDPSHVRLLPASEWSELCVQAGLTVQQVLRREKKQPDLEWYFEAAGTAPENRQTVRELISNASDSIRNLYRISEEEGKIVWQWPMLTLIATRQDA